MIYEHPMEFVDKLKAAEPRKRLLTEDQRQALWKTLESDPLLYCLVTLAVNLPFRRGQLLALTPESANFENNTIEGKASKGKGVRSVPMNATVQVIIKGMIRDGLLPFPIKYFQKRWERVMRESGINKEGMTREQNFHFHDLRTWLGTELIRHNVSPYYVQELFAHSDIKTSSIYMNAEPSYLAEAMGRIDIKSEAVN